MASEKEKMLAGELYDPFASELVTEREHARELVRLYNQTTEADEEVRELVLKELFGSVGEELFIEPPFRCDYGEQISVGDRSVVASGAVVTQDVPDDVVVQGNPAEVVKELD